jgi:hypothetical protein
MCINIKGHTQWKDFCCLARPCLRIHRILSRRQVSRNSKVWLLILLDELEIFVGWCYIGFPLLLIDSIVRYLLGQVRLGGENHRARALRANPCYHVDFPQSTSYHLVKRMYSEFGSWIVNWLDDNGTAHTGTYHEQCTVALLRQLQCSNSSIGSLQQSWYKNQTLDQCNTHLLGPDRLNPDVAAPLRVECHQSVWIVVIW